MNVIWHDLECGTYAADIALWKELAARHGDPILDVGAGTGRITLELARAGHRVTALDSDAELLEELRHRAGELPVRIVHADARDFELADRFALCIVPMQTIQLLGGAQGRARFLRLAKHHLRADGALAIAISASLELYDIADGEPYPLPDICELDGVVYSSQPTAVRAERDGFVLERQREVIGVDGSRTVSPDRIRLDQVSAVQLAREGIEAGLTPVGVEIVEATQDYVGSEVVLFDA
jgi:SAM-dependent methyltransferase